MKLFQNSFLHDLGSLVSSIRLLRAILLHILDSLTQYHPWTLSACCPAVSLTQATTSPLSFLSMISKHKSIYRDKLGRRERYGIAQKQQHLNTGDCSLNFFLWAMCYDSFYLVLYYAILSHSILLCFKNAGSTTNLMSHDSWFNTPFKIPYYSI